MSTYANLTIDSDTVLAIIRCRVFYRHVNLKSERCFTICCIRFNLHVFTLFFILLLDRTDVCGNIAASFEYVFR